MGDHVSFIRQDLRPAVMSAVDPDALNPRARALIFLPDLVTEFIETAFSEPIAVTCLSQKQATDIDDPGLDHQPGDPVIVRDSLIYGAETGRRFIHASVHLVEDRVPAGLISDLLETERGLGRLLSEHEVHHEREMLWFGVLSREDTGPGVLEALDADALAVRCYRLVSEGQPFSTIIERFPLELFGRTVTDR